ncbi:glycosyltransferase family 2 protein [uncultured Roseivirga sp.]|uniref:glycosyltransferase family 2 protein n=1 Tax=uncultured Roseivirga sp. TaxID=543088 RepID=UPI000D7AE0E1|nr:glycosyltransferase family 2 protein [uncultured Roseivirga sp.]PWL32329.1 MAG: hypothetical protein DCO95_03890 [Roseivirga sp. XM-24bin3]
MNPLVSIIVPVFNREKFLAETIESVVNQTYSNWELLLVDDGSTDGSILLAKGFASNDNRIKSILRNREPKGAPVCRNIGLENAKGDYVIFLDSDDLMASYCLEQRVQQMKEYGEIDFITFPTLIFKTSINGANRLVNIRTSEPEIYRFLRSDVVWCTPSAIWRRRAIQKLSGFDELLSNNQDQELYIRALLTRMSYRSCLNLKPDNYYRSHDGNRIYSRDNQLKTLLGVHYLLMKLSKVFSNEIKSDEGYRKNLTIFFKHSVRKLTRLNQQELCKSLIREYNKTRLISWVSFLSLLIYLKLSAFKLSKVKGYERFWNLFLGSFAIKKEWGKHKYSQRL